MNKFTPTLQEYDEFAESLGFKFIKCKDGVLRYVHEEARLMPFELGKIYRFCHRKYAEGIEDSLNYLKTHIEKAKTQQELIHGINEFIKEMKDITSAEQDKLK
jgi:hypothetical protein